MKYKNLTGKTLLSLFGIVFLFIAGTALTEGTEGNDKTTDLTTMANNDTESNTDSEKCYGECIEHIKAEFGDVTKSDRHRCHGVCDAIYSTEPNTDSEKCYGECIEHIEAEFGNVTESDRRRCRGVCRKI